MRNNLIVALIFIAVLVAAIARSPLSQGNSEFISPEPTSTPVETPDVHPSPTPQLNFNSSTDLNSELNLVNAKVTASDFASIQNTIGSLK